MSKRKTAQMRNAAKRMRAEGFDLMPSFYIGTAATTKCRFRETLLDFMRHEWIRRLRKTQATHTCAPRPKRRPRPSWRARGLPF